jgi:hypothetical protein
MKARKGLTAIEIKKLLLSRITFDQQVMRAAKKDINGLLKELDSGTLDMKTLKSGLKKLTDQVQCLENHDWLRKRR